MTKARDIANLGDSLINDADDNVALGDGALDSQTTGTNNVAIGEDALASVTTASDNTAIGYQAATATTGGENTAVGKRALYSNTSGQFNSSLGLGALFANTTGNYNTALGNAALGSSTTASNNTAVGYQAGYANTTGTDLALFGFEAGYSNTTGIRTTAFGRKALRANTTGSDNTAIGHDAGVSTTTGIRNTYVGRYAGGLNVTGNENTYVGRSAGASNTGSNNAFFGEEAGYSQTSGSFNSYLGIYSGGNMTTGSKNTIVGRFSGNQGGLDIRTASNRVVISDGDGNPRYYINANGEHYIGNSSTLSGSWDPISTDCVHTIGGPDRSGLTSSMYARVVVQERTDNWISFVNGTPIHYGTISRSGSGVSYGSNSDYRLKENIVDLTDATTRLKQLEPKRFNFIDNPDTTTDGFLAHEVQAIVPEAVTGAHNGTVITGNVEDAEGNIVHENVKSDIELAEGETFVPVKTEPEYQQLDPAKLVPLLVATIKELEARITALEAN